MVILIEILGLHDIKNIFPTIVTLTYQIILPRESTKIEISIIVIDSFVISNHMIDKLI